MAVVIYRKDSNNFATYTCGAIILSNKKLITPASCVYDRGDITLAVATVNSDEPYYEINLDEEEIIIHPKYTEYSRGAPENDIAVIQLKRALKFGKKVGTISTVSENYKIMTGEAITILGYAESNLSYRKYADTHLRYFNSTVADFKKCQDAHSESVSLDNENQLCITRFSNGDKNKYTGGIIT